MTPAERKRENSRKRTQEIRNSKGTALYDHFMADRAAYKKAKRLRDKFGAIIQSPTAANVHLKYCSSCKQRRERRLFAKEGRYWKATCAYCDTGISDVEANKVLTRQKRK